jgi:hypothetical protein
MKRLFRFLLPMIAGILLVFGLMQALDTREAKALTAQTQTAVINAGLAYLKANQQPDGGITGFSGSADPDTTARSVLAFATSGTPLDEVVSSEGETMVDYLATQAVSFTHDLTGTLFPGRAGELLAAVSLTGEDPSTFGGMDLVRELESSYHADTGVYSTTARQDYTSGAASDLNQAWVILGLGLAGKNVPAPAAQYLVERQAADGSWGMGDPDTTALVVTALLANRSLTVEDASIQKAIGYFHATQLESAGWRPAWDTDPLNADSTGWILQALVSADEDPQGLTWVKNNTNPVDALLALQKPDGSIGGTYANTYSTAEAIIGLSGIPLSGIEKAAIAQRAGLVVFSGDNTAFTECISFTSSSFNGLQLLQSSALQVETATNPSQGTAVCKIGQVGDPSNKCFGSMPNYWAYFVMGSNGWEYSPVGAEKSLVVDGGVYAWSWGTGNPPAILTFQNICEGVAFILPTVTATTPPTVASTATTEPLATPIMAIASQPAATHATAGTSVGSYIIYGIVILVLVLLVIFMVRSRRA